MARALVRTTRRIVFTPRPLSAKAREATWRGARVVIGTHALAPRRMVPGGVVTNTVPAGRVRHRRTLLAAARPVLRVLRVRRIASAPPTLTLGVRTLSARRVVGVGSMAV